MIPGRGEVRWVDPGGRIMPQRHLPLFPAGVTHITNELAFERRDGKIAYFNGHMPVFVHAEDDVATFRMITSQFCESGYAKQSDIIRAFGVTSISVKRAVKLYREPSGRGREFGGGRPEAWPEAKPAEKGGGGGRFPPTHKKNLGGEPIATSTKSQRSEIDCAAPMGRGATATLERMAPSLGQLQEVEPSFNRRVDLPHGGVLLALPALLVSGLLSHTNKYFSLPAGFYGLKAIFLLLAFMSLARIKTIEALRYHAPGEWGKLLGVDRAPEVRTIRSKVKHLANQEQAFSWSAELCKTWMAEAPEDATVLYIDGHVRVYHGTAKTLPKHYVARQRLCLSATADYWVNAMDGQPFFIVRQAVDPGLLQVMERDLIPRRETDVPNQPSQQQLEDDPSLHRFTVGFDREGYSPAFLAAMKKKRIACLTYHKHPGEDWPKDEFLPTPVRLASGHETTMQLAERGTLMSNRLWLREIRKLSPSGRQTAILSTDYRAAAGRLAPAMFARWSQENFFRYMRQSYNLDSLADYRIAPVPETTRVVNPAYRAADGKVRKTVASLSRKTAQFGAMNLEGEIEAKKIEAFTQRKAGLQEDIEHLRKQAEELKALRKATERHVTYDQLPKGAQFDRLSTQSKHLIDTIKMVAYRAETAMAQIVRQKMTRHDDARSLLRAIYNTEADMVPDIEAKTLTIRLHPLASHSSDQAVGHLCDELNSTETVFPGTELRLIYELVSSQIH